VRAFLGHAPTKPTTALDMTTQAQIIELLRAVRGEFGMALVLISHDLAVVAGLADRILVMYAGSVVENAIAEELFKHPRHPYTAELLKCMPSVTDRARPIADPCRATAATRRNSRGVSLRAALLPRRRSMSVETPQLEGSSTSQAACHFHSLHEQHSAAGAGFACGLRRACRDTRREFRLGAGARSWGSWGNRDPGNRHWRAPSCGCCKPVQAA